jgi:kynurenine formamidase
MRQVVATLGIVGVVMLMAAPGGAWAQVAKDRVAQSPWGPADEIGTLNMMTETSRLAILKQIGSGKVYDLSVELYAGMPSCCGAFGDPPYHLWMTHTPRGTLAANPFKVSRQVNERVAYSGDAVSMYTHTGTHIDTLNHFGLHGKIWNQFSADDHLGDQGWAKAGADKYPPIVARGVLIDVAKAKGMTPLPASYSITVADLQMALQQQGTRLQAGDVVLFRTGLMTLWPDPAKYQLGTQAGLSLEAAQWLVEVNQAMLLGGDNFGVESFPSTDPGNYVPVHTYLFAERGVSIIEVLWLEDLAKDQVYEFVFLAAPLKLRGATGSPLRPLAIPTQR